MTNYDNIGVAYEVAKTNFDVYATGAKETVLLTLSTIDKFMQSIGWPEDKWCYATVNHNNSMLGFYADKFMPAPPGHNPARQLDYTLRVAMKHGDEVDVPCSSTIAQGKRFTITLGAQTVPINTTSDTSITDAFAIMLTAFKDVLAERAKAPPQPQRSPFGPFGSR